MTNSKKSLSSPFNDFLDQSVGHTNHATIDFRIRRSLLIALIFSLLLHAVLAFRLVKQEDTQQVGGSKKLDTIVVTLAPPPTAQEPKQAEPQTPKQKQKKKKQVKKKLKVIAKNTSTVKPTQSNNVSIPKAIIPPAPTKTPQPVETPPVDAPTDMASYVKQQQAKRQSEESAAARENAAAIAKQKGPSKEEKLNQRILENLREGGTSLFHVVRLDALGATVSFAGWYANGRKEYFEVPAQPGQRLELLIVKRIIKRIRQDFSEDFPWRSHRLNRVITMSARPEDNDGLEDFLMQEIF